MAATLDPLDSGASTTTVSLNNQDLQFLRTAGKWGRFIAIVSFVSIGLGILSLIVLLTASSIGSGAGLGETGAIGVGIVMMYIPLLLAYIYPTVKLFQFSSNAIQAADARDGLAASEAFSALKSLFKFLGILLIIVIALYALVMIGAAAFGMAAIG